MNAAVEIEQKGNVAVLSLNRPERLNAFTQEMAREIADFLEESTHDDEVRAVVVTGRGKAFCGGGDISVLEAIEGSPGHRVHQELLDIYAVFESLARYPKPLIVGVNGVTAGIGIGLALAGDYIVACAQSRFHLAFFDRGLMPEPFTLHAMARRSGLAHTRRILFGDHTSLTASDALTLGLVDETVPSDELESRVGSLAARLASGPSIAYAMTKSMLRDDQGAELSSFLARGALAQTMCVGTSDFREGVLSFRDRRPAEFTGH